MNWRAEFKLLADAGVPIRPGLTETELAGVESVVRTALPPDLREFLSEGLPLGKGFPNWRDPESSAIHDQLAWPFEGMAFDIEHNTFWLDAWRWSHAVALRRSQGSGTPTVPVPGRRRSAPIPETQRARVPGT